MKVAKNNTEEHGSNYVRATIENEILDEIIAGKPSELVAFKSGHKIFVPLRQGRTDQLKMVNDNGFCQN